MKHREIERKWLLEGFPDETPECRALMEQGYLDFAPTVRIRREAWGEETRYWLTIKGEGTLARTEVELPLDADQYEALGGLLATPPVPKEHRRYRLPGGETLECNLVDAGAPTAFYYAEVEFPGENQADAFVPPPWLGREVTQEPGWSMAAYARFKAGLGPWPPV